MTQRFIFSLAAATLLGFAPLSNADLAAQQGLGTRMRVPVTVALVERLQDYGDGPAVILRRSDVAPRDVILLRAEAANAQQLSRVVFDLLAIRRQVGDTASITGAVRVRPQKGAPARTPRELPWAQRVVDDVRRAELQNIPGVGMVRAVQIWLPPQHKHLKY
jgi:hypothetical protein